jgi:hypothetical protein
MSKQWWQEQEWKGMKAATPRAPRRMEAAPFVPCTPFTWVPWAIPAESQNGPSCAGHEIANEEEVMRRRFAGLDSFKVWQQIDGDAVHAEARRMFYGGNMDGGLYLTEAFQAALEMGIYAPGTQLLTIPRRKAMYSPQFEKTPFLDGHDVSGWVKHGLKGENGQVFEGAYPDGTGGHATLHVSRMTQEGQNFWQDLNSWGPKFGWHGCFIMSESQDEITALEDVMYYIERPEGWEKWDGWRKWVIG